MEILLNEFQLLSKTILTQLAITAKLFKDPSLDTLYAEMEANEIIIDRMEIKIREEVIFSIFKFNPMAADLRRIIAYQEITHNLERVGDMLINVIHRLPHTAYKQEDTLHMGKVLEKMLGKVTDMLRDAILAFTSQDAQMAYNVIARDDEVDELFHRLQDHLKSYQPAPTDTNANAQIIHTSIISYNLERMGDSATNIAEAIIFITDGKDIRHGKTGN